MGSESLFSRIEGELTRASMGAIVPLTNVNKTLRDEAVAYFGSRKDNYQFSEDVLIDIHDEAQPTKYNIFIKREQ